MPVYKYEAMNSSGQEIRDEVTAASKEEAISKIRNKGLFPVIVRRKEEKLLSLERAEAVRKEADERLRLGGLCGEESSPPADEKRSKLALTLRLPALPATHYMLIMFGLGVILGWVLRSAL